MSESDRKKWDARYAGVHEAPLQPPSDLLQHLVTNPTADGSLGPLTRLVSGTSTVSNGRALDVACGGGRNALWLAGRGFTVDGLDISGIGLQRGRTAARNAGLEVNWIQADLDRELPLSSPYQSGPYQLILMMRYLNLACLTRLQDLLAPGGWLVAEVYLDPEGLDATVSGPRNPEFLARPGALRGALDELVVAYYREGLVENADRREALVQVFAYRSRVIQR